MITLIIAKLSAPKISNFINTGINGGGRETSPLNSTIPIKIDAIVINMTPISIAPETFLTAKIAINRNPSIESIVSLLNRSPILKRVASFGTMMPPFFKPISPMKSPTPEPIAILRFIGILSNIHCLIGVMLIIQNKIPAMNTAPRAISHE